MRELITFSPSSFLPDRRIGSDYAMVRGAIAVPAGWRSIRRLADVKGPGLFPFGAVTGGHVHLYPASQSFQYSYPVADVSVTTWRNELSAVVDLYKSVDEQAPSNVDYAFCPGAPSAQLLTFSATPIADPGVNTDHYLRYGYKVTGVTGTWFMKFRLYRGATLVKENSHTGTTPVDWVTVEYLVPTGDVATILSAEYGSLRLAVEATVPGVAQVVRPVADVSLGGWTNQAGSATNVYQAIDESSPSDADYARSAILFEGGQESVYRFRLAAATDPNWDPSFPVVLRMAGNNSGVKAVVKIYDGNGTFVAERTWTNLSETFANYTITLSTAEVALIVNWQLEVEVRASYPSNVAATKFQYLRPVADTANVPGNWQNQAGSFTDLFESIDEASLDTGDYIFYITLGSFVSGYYEVALTSVSDPGVDREVTLTVHYLQDLTSGDDTFQLYGPSLAWQGNVDFEQVSPKVFTLSAAEVAQVSDWANVKLRVTANAAGWLHRIYMVELKVPDGRRLYVSQAYADAPTLAAGYCSWMHLRTPSATSFYSGDLITKFVGNAADLYTIDPVAGWTDVGKAGSYGSSGNPGAWRGCSYGPHVVMTNWFDPVQWRQNNVGLFADLITSTSKPKARFCAVLRNVLLLGGISFSGHSDDEVWGSSFDNIQDFEPSPSTGARYYPIRGVPGQLTGLVGGDYALAFKAGSVHLIRWIGGNLLWGVYTLATGIGCPYPGSIVTADGWHYFVGTGWRIYRANDQVVEAIGGGELWEFLRGKTGSTLAPARVDPLNILEDDLSVVGAYSREANAIFWSFFSGDDVTTFGSAYKSGQLVYSLTTGRFSICPQRRPDPDEVSDHYVSYLMATPRSRQSTTEYVPDLDYFTLELAAGTQDRSGEVMWSSPTSPTHEELELTTHVFQVQSDGHGPSRIWSILPVLHSSDQPVYQLTVRGALDHEMLIQLEERVISSLDAREDGHLPVDMTKQWWQLILKIPSSTKSIEGVPAFIVEVEQRRGEVSP